MRREGRVKMNEIYLVRPEPEIGIMKERNGRETCPSEKKRMVTGRRLGRVGKRSNGLGNSGAHGRIQWLQD
jgi:hypothetical protein